MRALLLTLLLPGSLVAQSSPASGRWDLVVRAGTSTAPMWLELVPGPVPTGRLQNVSGHALPITTLEVDGPRVTFTVPTEGPTDNPERFTATVQGDALTGTIVARDGRRREVTGRRAPTLARSRPPEWGDPIDLLANGLGGWQLRMPQGPSSWAY